MKNKKDEVHPLPDILRRLSDIERLVIKRCSRETSLEKTGIEWCARRLGLLDRIAAK